MDDVLERVKKRMIERLDIKNADDLSMKSHIANDLGADSLDIVELIMDFEDEFDISIPDSDAESISTIGEVVKYIEDKINNNSTA
ncbi:acyl carrier protein [Candidatus Xenohaliotis californiensis]|uniref:Acyl carrier protein n=1 Tax=Candidatus Xenohaliotis californiensis TaxID=84677 RepID=A0ABM9N8F1_9RICK|nr:acyl carrier protein [Candidatus Xenohaliotis californiensis]